MRFSQLERNSISLSGLRRKARGGSVKRRTWDFCGSWLFVYVSLKRANQFGGEYNTRLTNLRFSLSHLSLVVETEQKVNFSFYFRIPRTLGTHTPLSTDPAKKATLLCFTTPQLNTKQRDLCRRHPTLMASVAKGAKEAIEECQIQFRLRRWNCSSLPESGTLFDPILNRGKCLHWEYYTWLQWYFGVDRFKICLLKPKGFVFLVYSLFVMNFNRRDRQSASKTHAALVLLKVTPFINSSFACVFVASPCRKLPNNFIPYS